jgi:hypothetical protein
MITVFHAPQSVEPVRASAYSAFFETPSREPTYRVFVLRQVGTGGLQTVLLWAPPVGYRLFDVEYTTRLIDDAPDVSFSSMMEKVKNGFGRNFSRLPSVFGVSRQSLYNWVNGETPNERHQPKIAELSKAAQVFEKHSFTPTQTDLDHPLVDGKSFLELMAEGHAGAEHAQMLVRVSKRNMAALARLDALLGTEDLRPDQADMGTPAFREDI